MNNINDVLLISEKYIKSNTTIGENVSGNFILPAIKQAQDINLENVIGTVLLKNLQLLIFSNKVDEVENEKYKVLLNDYIQQYLCYAVLSSIVIPISMKINNIGVNKTDDEKNYSASINEVNQLKDYYSQIADYYKYRLQLYLIENYNYFVELSANKKIDNIKSNLYSAAGCSLWLGGCRGKGLPMSYNDYMTYKYK